MSGIHFLIAALVHFVSAGGALAKAVHPLDPLDAAEITSAVKVASAHAEFPKGSLFPMVALQEPPKQEVLSYLAGNPFRREAMVLILDRAHSRTIECVVDLRARKVASWKEIPGVQPLVLNEEYDTVPKIVKADPGWQEAMKKRGITDFSQTQIDTWAAGSTAPEQYRGHRLLRAITYFKGKDENFYGRPIEGVLALVSMNENKVVELTDTGIVPLPPPSQDFDEKSIGNIRKGLKPLEIRQPQGVSFKVSGREVRWQKWRFRYAIHPREGLVLYQVGYEDGGKVRPILYRASLSEMAVPYADPDGNWSWRAAFDAGEYGVGRLGSPLEPKNDVPPNAAFVDATFADDFGSAYRFERIGALYERDAGLLWKHYDIYTRKNHSRRGRELVLTFIAAIGNYDYALSWIFGEEGSIAFEAALTGILLPKGVAEESISCGCHSPYPNAHLISKNLVAPHHQHFFSMRLDFDVDGEKNSVSELNTLPMAGGKANPLLNAFRMEEKILATEKDARRDLSLAEARKWKVWNPSVRGKLGHNPGYIVIPAESAVPYLDEDSIVRRRAPFLEHHFWATRYDAAEMHSAGEYPNQSSPDVEDGLKAWSGEDPIAGEDVVAWYTFGVTHVPRPEEWPIMSAHRTGFKMIPAGFFDRNPALDVPKTR